MSNLKKNYPNYKEIDKAFQRYVEASTIYGKRLLELDKDSHRDIDDEESRKVKKKFTDAYVEYRKAQSAYRNLASSKHFRAERYMHPHNDYYLLNHLYIPKECIMVGGYDVYDLAMGVTNEALNAAKVGLTRDEPYQINFKVPPPRYEKPRPEELGLNPNPIQKKIKPSLVQVCYGLVMTLFITFGVYGGSEIVNAYHVINGSEYVINGTVTHNSENADVIYLSYNNSDNPFDFVWVVDSAKIVNDKFTFRGRTDYPTQTFLSTNLYNAVEYKTKEQTAVLYTAPRNEISCVINLEHPFDSIKVYNSPTDEDLRYVINKMKPINDRIGSIQLQYSLAESVGDITQMAKLRNEFDIVNIERTKDWLSTLLSLDKTSAVVFDDYVSMLLNNEYITKEQFIQIENRFNEVPWYIKNCNSGKRVSKAIESTKKYFNEKS
jgi:hypothetical protein